MALVRPVLVAVLAVAALWVGATSAFAGAIIGNWAGSSRSWNSTDMSAVAALVTGAGHTVEADEALTAANLANDALFIIGEPAVGITAQELADLTAWVNGGGVLLLLADLTAVGLPTLNDVAAGVGTSLAFGDVVSGGGSDTLLSGGNFATDGPPFDIVGEELQVSLGRRVTGGSVLSDAFLRYEAVGLGWVFAFADRSDYNGFIPDATGVNGRLFLNLAHAADAPVVPEPATSALALLGLGAVAARRTLALRR